MKQVMYGIRIANINAFGGWVGYEENSEKIAKTLNGNLYLFFVNEFHCKQFMEGRKFVINVKDNDANKTVDNVPVIKAIVEYGTVLSMNGYELGASTYARNVVKPLSRATHFIEEKDIYSFAQAQYQSMNSDFNYIADLMYRTSIKEVDELVGSISFVNKNLLYHYPHYFVIGESQVKVLDDTYEIK